MAAATRKRHLGASPEHSPPRSKPAPTKAPAGSITAGRRSRPAVSRARSSRSQSHASSPATAGRPPPCSRQPSPASTRRAHRRKPREERPARRLRAANPHRPRSNLDSGNTPHLAHPVMRSRPAHISRDHSVGNSRCAPPADKHQPQQRPKTHAPLTNHPPYQPPVFGSVWSASAALHLPGSAYQTRSGSSYSSMKPARSSARREGAFTARVSATTRLTPGRVAQPAFDSASTTLEP